MTCMSFPRTQHPNLDLSYKLEWNMFDGFHTSDWRHNSKHFTTSQYCRSFLAHLKWNIFIFFLAFQLDAINCDVSSWALLMLANVTLLAVFVTVPLGQCMHKADLVNPVKVFKVHKSSSPENIPLVTCHVPTWEMTDECNIDLLFHIEMP